MAERVGPDVPQLVRDLHCDGGLRDCDVLHIQAAPRAPEQAPGQGGREEGREGAGIPLFDLG